MDGGTTARFGSSFTADQLRNGLTIPVLQPTPDANRETGSAGGSSSPLTTISCNTRMILIAITAIDLRDRGDGRRTKVDVSAIKLTSPFNIILRHRYRMHLGYVFTHAVSFNCIVL
jgi:hypothetical protein